MAEKQNFPVFSEKNWWVLKQQLRSSMPSSVTTNYVKTLFSLTSNDAANANISNLKRLGLIDEEGKPTQLANEWRLDESYRAACEKILKAIYPNDLLDLFPEKDVDRNKVKNWFMSQNGVGDNTAGQMTALFLLLKSGEIKETKSNGTKSASKKTTKESRKDKNADSDSLQAQEHTKTANHDDETKRSLSTNNRPNLHIDLQIHISPESTPEQIDMIFASMAKHLYGLNKS